MQSVQGLWETTRTPHQHRHLDGDACALCEATGIHQVVRMEDVRTLNEATYKELAGMIDGNFLSQKVRSDALDGIRLLGFEGNIMRFRINSSEFAQNRIQYQCSVQFDDWDEVGPDPDLNYAEKARLLLWVGNIRLHCTDPSYLYWGYNYLLTVLDAAIYPEERKPVIRNPQERGIVCKHLNRILRVLPFYSGKIAAELKSQFGTQ
jgi:hypothetical protein